MKTLHLNLKRKWFDLIQSGEKTEEYREMKNHWKNILGYEYGNDSGLWVDGFWYGAFKPFNIITFSNGYATDRPQFEIELKGIRIGTGKEEWGAEPGKRYFVLELGEIIEHE